MLIRVFTLRFDPTVGVFDDRALREFIADKTVVSASDHFFVHEGLPHLAMIITYAPQSEPDHKGSRKDNWRDLITGDDMPLFDTLRDWRSERGKQDGVPPYVICTNRELAQVVNVRPQSLHALAQIPGFGSAKVKKYGREITRFFSAGDEESEGGS